MLIRATADFEVQNLLLGRPPLPIAAGDFADLPLPAAQAAVEQGAAVAATIEEARAARGERGAPRQRPAQKRRAAGARPEKDTVPVASAPGENLNEDTTPLAEE